MLLMNKLLDALRLQSTKEPVNTTINFDVETHYEDKTNLFYDVKDRENVQQKAGFEMHTNNISLDNIKKTELSEESQDESKIQLCEDTLTDSNITETLKEQPTESENQLSEDTNAKSNTIEILDELQDDISVFSSNEVSIEENPEKNNPYKSNRQIINGLHIFFIDVVREILEQNRINIIPLMREYRLTENDLKRIIQEMQEANILDKNKKIIMDLENFEKFIDFYDPELFKCEHTTFDKKNFIDLGDIIFSSGMESIYDILPPNEIIDYLNIMEKLEIISYDEDKNLYNTLISRENFFDICKYIPNYSNVSTNMNSEINIDNMDGHQFEYFCADIIRECGFEDVEVTQGSGDHGIDILAKKDDITYAIQCKCYSSDIGNAAIQQAHSGKGFYNKDIAVVLTNRYFTTQAIEEANALGVKLWDRDKLNSMILKK